MVNALGRLTVWGAVLWGGLALTSCAATFEPLIAHRAWDNTPKEQVFDAAVRVLHSQDFMIAAADKSSGIISTDWRDYARGKTRLRMRLNLLVLVEQTGGVDLSYKSVVQRFEQNDWTQLVEHEDRIDSDMYAKMTRHLDDFFLEVERYCGPSAQIR